MERICKVCQDEYDPRHPAHRGGHIDVCGGCEDKRADVIRTIGFVSTQGKTNYEVEILPEPSGRQRSLVATQGRCGPGQCHTSLGLDTNGATTAKKDLDRVLAGVYKDD